MAGMKKSFFPERKSTTVIVSVAYPGASPKEMEEGITIKVEEAIRGIIGIKEVSSTSSENFANVVITTTGDYDLQETLIEVENAVSGINTFPVDAERPLIYKTRSMSRVGFLALKGDCDLMTLKKEADDIEIKLLNSGVISKINVSGYPPIEISVEVTEQNLMRYGITFEQISRAIAMNNTDISVGQIKSDDEEILIRSRNRSVKPEDIGNIILKANIDGSYIKIQDIADVKLQFADIPAKSYMNGLQSISISVEKLQEEDLSKISDYLHKFVDEYNIDHKVTQLYFTYDFYTMLKQRLALLYNNGGMGLILVLIFLGLFLNFRLSIWVAWGIPSSFLAMFIVASLYGITINMISLFGMILVIGILVDDGIVIAENIFTHFQKGKSPKQAAIDGSMEVIPAVITSVLTTIVSFSPLLFLSGMMEFMFEMAFVVIFSLIFSLVEAFLVLPAHLANSHVLRVKRRVENTKSFRGKLDKGINYVKDNLYGKFLHWLIKWRVTFFFVPIGLILITVGLIRGGFVGTSFMPNVPFDQFNLDIAFIPGSGEKKTETELKHLENLIWEVDTELKTENNDTIGYIKYTFLSVGSAFNGKEQGGHAGNIFILLHDLEKSTVSSYEILKRIQDKIGDVPEAEKFNVKGRNMFGDPISFSLLSSDINELTDAKNYLISEMQKISSITSINDNNAIGKQEVLLKLKPKAYFLGLNQNIITSQIRRGFYGGLVQKLQLKRDEIRVWVRYPKTDRISLGQLETMKIKTIAGEIPLSELATYTFERSPSNIQRFNSSREVQISASMVNSDEPTVPVVTKIETEIMPKLLSMYPSIIINARGQQKDSKESGMQLAKYFGLAFLIILMIIMIHFKSFMQAIIVLMMIPLGWLGAIWGHGLEGITVSMMSAWGLVALAGVIINDAIVFLQKYNQNLVEKMNVYDAVYDAAKSRFRAILLTTITTVVGLYPIIWEKSFQAQFLKPMAVSLAYGVMLGTMFILIFFPILILIINDMQVYFKWLWTGEKPNRESLTVAVKNELRNLE